MHDERLKGTKKIGFVPTMGALHDGHISLIKASKKNNQITVCSIFVNPTQFNNLEDLEKYPRDLEKDIKFLVEHECDVLFLPEVNEIYQKDEIKEVIDYGNVTNDFEGKFRPGHFDGVVMIVKKFFQIIEPDNTYFGQKDYQQCLVIEHLIKRNQFPVNLIICPTLREHDGLAMSSRNARLTEEERKAAAIIPQTLNYIKQHIHQIPLNDIIYLAIEQFKKGSSLMNIEYLDIVDSKNIQHLSEINETTKAIVLIAVWCGKIRLIDNLILAD